MLRDPFFLLFDVIEQIRFSFSILLYFRPMKTVKDPGLGSAFRKPVSRLMNGDGTYNIVRKGGLSGINDFYKFLVEIHWFWFVLILVGGYFVINLIFAFIYYFIGLEQISGADQNALSDFKDAFFFSSQTFTTVGYGALAPKGLAASYVSMIESFLGLSSFAIATGLLWGRFSRPVLKIAFSDKIIVTPFEGTTAVMFKMVNMRNNVLLNSKVKCLFIIDKGTGEHSFNKEYAELKMETDEVKFFPLTWTLVHKIDSDSPFYGMSLNDLNERHAEVIILVETFDETYSQVILHKHSYGAGQFMENVRFDRNFEANEKGQVVLDVKAINKVIPLDS